MWQYEKMDGLDVDIPSVFDVFGSITDVTFVCDYLYRYACITKHISLPLAAAEPMLSS